MSSDISGFLFKDLIREVVPAKKLFKGRDRAYQSMQNYARLVEKNNHLAINTSFRSYWKQVYEINQKSYPALIVNTTPTRSKYGVACSISDMDNFPIAIDLLSDGNEALSFAGTISTSNRFPIFSPAARVPGKGHFVDGGYFF